MSGEEAEPQLTTGWYVIAREGDLVLRISAGMQVGEDAGGELSFDSADSQVEFEVDAQGEVVVLASAGRELATGSGDRTRRIQLARDARAQILLGNNVLSIATDFVDAPPFSERPMGGGDDSHPFDSIIVVPEPTADPCAVAGSHAVPNGAADLVPFGGMPVAPGESRPPVVLPRRRQLLVPLALSALGSIAALALLYVGLQPPIDFPLRAAAVADPPGSTPAPEPRPAPEAVSPVPAVLSGDSLADPTDEAEAEAEAQPSPALATATLIPAPSPATPTMVIETVLVPPIPRRHVEPPAEAATPAPARPSQPPPDEAAEFAAVTVDFEQLGAAVQRITADRAGERALREAADALENGFLVRPPAASALVLYRRVLTSTPHSEAARAGLQLVRERLLGQARAYLDADDPAAAIAALDDAALADADRSIVAQLRTEADHRQRLHDAIEGRPGALFPITELTAISQMPPDYPRHAPAGAEDSVAIEMTVTERGNVRDVEVLGDPPMYFLRAAKRAVSEWRFAPVLHDGQPVAVRTAVTVTFRRDPP